MRCLACLVAVLLLLPLGAVAGEPNAAEVQRARAYYEAGSGLYQLGRYDEAMREFSAGYALSHRPLFALNIAQCYRQLGRLEEARDLIRRFLDEAPADAPERESAKKLLAETEAQLNARTQAPSVAVAPPSQQPAPSVAVALPPARSPRAEPRRSHRGLFIALGISGAALVAGAAVAIAVVAANPTQTVPSTTLGTVRF